MILLIYIEVNWKRLKDYYCIVYVGVIENKKIRMPAQLLLFLFLCGSTSPLGTWPASLQLSVL